MKLKTAVLIAGVLAVVVWLALWAFVILLSTVLPAGQASKYGQVGDMFGAGSSLFSAIAVAAVAVVLVFDVNERRRDLEHREQMADNDRLGLRPYVVGYLADRDGRIDQSQWIAGQLHVTLVFKITLRNQTADPALNVTLSMRAEEAGDASAVVAVPLPLSEGNLETAELSLSLRGSEASSALRDIANRSYSVAILINYTSLNGTSWYSRVKYEFGVGNASVAAIIPNLQDEQSGESIVSEGGFGGGVVYPLKAVASPGSWEQANVSAK
ncbi:hypothetical protein [Clavibacter sp. km1a]|uniref:hypothetical protein n=1 Tax=Clavibacter sp. km1a TaxID=3459136 RepID=UPI00404193FC